ncbi:gfo/Idh/MocA family oxidoreductase [Paenibacillaceae bacterium]|nr:gfo/Idh/MocA family oxidoreductase [Paenibacillaceae bacterium]
MFAACWSRWCITRAAGNLNIGQNPNQKRSVHMNPRIYIVGAGAIAAHHIQAILQHTSTEAGRPAVFVTDVNAAALTDFVHKFPWAVPFHNLESMLSSPSEPDDVVIVATPPSTHADITCRALRSGRHVLCEKPLAMNKEEAAMMLSAARDAGKLLGCCSSRFAGLKSTGSVQELLEQGRLGEVYKVQWMQRRARARSGVEYQPASRWFLNPAVSGGGTLMDWGPYDIAGLTEALRPVRAEIVHAWMANPETEHPLQVEHPFDVEQHVGALIKFHLRDGSIVPVHYERAACCHGEDRSIVEIEGTKGAVSWDWLSFNGEGERNWRSDLRGEQIEEKIVLKDQPIDMMARPIVYFLAAVAGEPSPAIVNEQAVFNFTLLASIYDFIRTGEAQRVELEGTFE